MSERFFYYLLVLNRTRALLCIRTPSLYHVTRGGGLPDTRHCSRILRPTVSVSDAARIFALGRRPVTQQQHP